MSYILEALRKAERERNAGKTPDLQIAPRSEARISKLPLARQWLTLGAAIFVGLCIGLALWLRPTSAPVPEATVATVTPAAEIRSSSTPEAIEPSDQSTVRLDDLLDKSSSDALPIQQQQRLGAEAAPHAPIIKPAEPESMLESAHALDPAVQPTLAEQATADPELPPELKKLKEMPPEYRSDFPSIRIDVHAYDEQPAKRFVMINGRRYREAEVLNEGPRIVSIEEDGIVFNYRNEEVLYPIAR